MHGSSGVVQVLDRYLIFFFGFPLTIALSIIMFMPVLWRLRFRGIIYTWSYAEIHWKCVAYHPYYSLLRKTRKQKTRNPKKRPDHELDLLKKLKIVTKSKICIFAGGSTSECV